MDAGALATIPLFVDMSEEERDRVAGVCSDLEVDAGQTLVTEGDFGYAMFAIAEGTADVVQDETVLRTLVLATCSARSRSSPVGDVPQPWWRRRRCA